MLKQLILLCVMASLTLTVSAQTPETSNEVPNESPEQIQEEVQPIIEEQSETLPPEPISYTWNNFVTNQNCTDYYQFIKDNPDYSNLIQYIHPYCQGDLAIWKDWLHTFRNEKKGFLIKNTMNENSKYLKYIKVIPYVLFDIQDTHSSTSLLDQIEQGIIDHQIEKVDTLLNQLPENWKSAFYNTRATLQRIQTIKSEFENIAQGGNND